MTGEGVILQKLFSAYERGRSGALVKLKVRRRRGREGRREAGGEKE